MKSAGEIATLCVDPERIDEVWPHVAEFIEGAHARMGGDDAADVVLNDIHLRHAQLWITWDGGAIIAAAATKLLKVARGTICVITHCGGRDMGPQAWRKCIGPIEDFARAEGCCALRFEGRRGWAAVFPDYREAWVALEKRL